MRDTPLALGQLLVSLERPRGPEAQALVKGKGDFAVTTEGCALARERSHGRLGHGLAARSLPVQPQLPGHHQILPVTHQRPLLTGHGPDQAARNVGQGLSKPVRRGADGTLSIDVDGPQAQRGHLLA